jgi:hypothetical protein
VAEAHAEHRDAAGERPDDLDRRARVLRPAGAGGDDQVRRRKSQRLGRVDGVVAPNLDVRAALGEQVVEVVGEAVVVVDDEDQGAKLYTVPVRSPA